MRTESRLANNRVFSTSIQLRTVAWVETSITDSRIYWTLSNTKSQLGY